MPKFAPAERWAIYARYSSDKQREASAHDQIRVCRDFLESGGGKFRKELVIKDEGVSGAGVDREGLKVLFALLATEPRSIDGILVEDVSRLSRDQADAHKLFRELAFLGVPLIGVKDGINTAEPGAKMTFTLRSLIAETYLDDLRDKTLRGLEGRFLAGYATGGLAFGFQSRPVTDAAGKIIGHAIEINNGQAVVVRRVFVLYLEGLSLAGIAKQLNWEGVPPARAKKKYKRKGWTAETIRAFLHNERYAGTWTFKRRQWIKEPGTNKRKKRKRKLEDLLRQERPHLAIIDKEIWDATQSRLAAVRRRYTTTKAGKPKGRALGGTSSTYPFSGLLVCGVCQAPMTIYGGTYRRYRCVDNVKRGTCTNSLSIREDVVRHGILGEVRRQFTSPWGLLYLRKLVAESLGASARTAREALEERHGRLTRTEQRIANLIQFVADGDSSERVTTALRDLEAQADAEKREIDQLVAAAQEPVALPSPAQIKAKLDAMDKMVTSDPARGREALRTFFKGGSIRMLPQPDRSYLARAELLPLAVMLGQTPTPAGVNRTASVYGSGCGGRI